MTSRRCWLPVLLVVAAVVAVPSLAWAQADTGVIDGRIFDESRLAVPGATITAKNIATGFTRTAVSGETGTYRIAPLPPGTYSVTAELSGFATMVFNGAIVQVGSSTNVDFTMKVATVAESITVTGESPLVQTTKSDVGQVISSNLISNMPLSGRRFQDLSLLVPGTRPSNYYDPTKSEVGGISYGGMSGRAVNITVDGGDNNDGVVRGLLQQMSADAIQEYKVTTGRYSAEFGRSTGGLVSVVTKSGTNQPHGSAFGFFRDAKLNAETYFEKQAGTGKQPFSQQQLGATAGGPIVKDRAFFFGSYEHNRRQDYRTVYTNGVLPAQEGPQLAPFRNHLILGRTDFQMGANQSLMVRFSREDNKRENDFIGGNTLKSAGALNTNVINMLTGKYTTVLGTSKVNEFLVQYQHFENNIVANDNSIPGVQTPDLFFGANLNTPQQTIQNRWQVKEDFAFRKEGWGGDHDFKVGGEIVKSHYGGFFIPTLYGYFIFNERLPGNDLNSYLNAIADTFTGSAGSNVSNDNWTSVGIYFQDDYHPTSNLTLNLGLRWDMQPGPYDNDFDTLALRAIAAAGYNTKRHVDKKDYGPRIGFAYDVSGDGKTVIRGGYGLYYDELFQNITLYERWSDVRTPLFFVSASPSPWTPGYYAANRDAIRTSFIDPTFAGQALRMTAPDLIQPRAHEFNVGGSHQFTPSLSIDFDYIHSIGKDEIQRWRINTAQNVSTRLSPAGVFAPDLGAFIVEGNWGHSRFDGVYLTGKVRVAQGQVLTSYAWTKAMALGDSFGTQPSDISNGNPAIDWGPTPNDVRHRFTLGATWPLWKGLQYSTILQANTGKPFNALAGLGGVRNAVRAIDPGTGEPFSRNAFRADGFFSWDMRFSYNFNVGNHRVVEALFEVFNITDHVNFDRDSYVTRYTSPSFGTPTEIINNSQRQAQFGLRFSF